MLASKTEDKLYEGLRRELSKVPLTYRSRFKIERQAHVGPYTPDFVLPELMVIVEVEGPHHYSQSASHKDHERENYFRNMGYLPLRISAEQVSDDPDSVATFVIQQAKNQQYRDRALSLKLDRTATIMLVEFADGIGFCLEWEEATKWWSLYVRTLRENWLKNGQAEFDHENFHWNRYMRGDKSVDATLAYESRDHQDALRFAKHLIGKRVIAADAENDQVKVKIEPS